MAHRYRVASALVAAALAGPALAQAQFNGNWSVLVETQRGTCDRAYRYAVAVENGRVRYAGPESFTVSGSVAANGAVSGSISRGETRVNVSGRLSGSSGSGTWTGSGGTNCAGRWTAEKQG
jgi:hypothetical protein